MSHHQTTHRSFVATGTLRDPSRQRVDEDDIINASTLIVRSSRLNLEYVVRHWRVTDLTIIIDDNWFAFNEIMIMNNNHEITDEMILPNIQSLVLKSDGNKEHEEAHEPTILLQRAQRL